VSALSINNSGLLANNGKCAQQRLRAAGKREEKSFGKSCNYFPSRGKMVGKVKVPFEPFELWRKWFSSCAFLVLLGEQFLIMARLSNFQQRRWVNKQGREKEKKAADLAQKWRGTKNLFTVRSRVCRRQSYCLWAALFRPLFTRCKIISHSTAIFRPLRCDRPNIKTHISFAEKKNFIYCSAFSMWWKIFAYKLKLCKFIYFVTKCKISECCYSQHHIGTHILENKNSKNIGFYYL